MIIVINTANAQFRATALRYNNVDFIIIIFYYFILLFLKQEKAFLQVIFKK